MRYLAIGLVLLALVMPAAAQQGTEQELLYGDAVVGELTRERFEVTYTFKGRDGDVVVIDLEANEDDTELQRPELVLQTVDGTVLFDTFGAFDFESAVLAAQLPSTGSYTLLVTRADGRTGSSVGTYTLRLLNPPELLPNEPITASVQNASPVNYYAVQRDEPFSVAYDFVEGELAPYINAYRVDNGALMNAATLQGGELLSGAIGLDGRTAPVHLISVGDSPFATYFDDRVETATYRLTLIVAR